MKFLLQHEQVLFNLFSLFFPDLRNIDCCDLLRNDDPNIDPNIFSLPFLLTSQYDLQPSTVQYRYLCNYCRELTS